MPALLIALVAVALPLATSICIESAVAALLGLRRQGLVAVVWVNFVTNPLLNLVWLSLFWLGLGYPLMWLVLALLEVVVILAEWRLLFGVLGGKAFGSRRLLAVSLVMNGVSATLGTFLLSLLV